MREIEKAADTLVLKAKQDFFFFFIFFLFQKKKKQRTLWSSRRSRISFSKVLFSVALSNTCTRHWLALKTKQDVIFKSALFSGFICSTCSQGSSMSFSKVLFSVALSVVHVLRHWLALQAKQDFSEKKKGEARFLKKVVPSIVTIRCFLSKVSTTVE